MHKQLSIVIANYNYGRYLETAIRSIANQGRMKEVEIIVCDAGSTDDSKRIIQKYANGLPPKTEYLEWVGGGGQNKSNSEQIITWWCSEHDSGQSNAFNKGFCHASGRFLTWLNADDVMLPGALNAILECIKKNPSARWLSGGTLYFDNAKLIRNASVLNPGFLYRALCVPSWLRVEAPSSIFRKELLGEVGGINEDLHYVMDIDLWMRFWKKGEPLINLKHYLWGFRVHEESKTSDAIVSNSKSGRFLDESMKIRVGNGIGRVGEKIWIFRKRLCSLLSLGFIRRAVMLHQIKTIEI